MINPQLITYMNAEIAKGISRDTIRQNLIQGGSWTDLVITEHFSAIDLGTTTSQVSTTSQEGSKNRRNIFLINLGIFILYTIGSILIKEAGFAMSLYIVHAAFLIVLSIVFGIWGLVAKKKMYAGDLFLTAIALCIIGFGTCYGLLASNLVNLNL
ncbi:hypothetical protein H7Y21_00470 [Arenimonas sp.]|nr:hypothetical protein [Candidatus Parcubacteria bacterium]